MAATFLAAIALAGAGVAATGTEAAPAPPVVAASAAMKPLSGGAGGIGGIAVKPNGQAAFVIDRADRSVAMIDLAEPGRRQPAVTSFEGDERPVAIACIDSITVALVVESGGNWTLRAYRLGPPGVGVAATQPYQTVSLGTSGGDRDFTGVAVAVSPSRDWLVIAGLPEPMPAMLRGAIAGGRIGGLSTRNCPESRRGGAAVGPLAVAVSPMDELVVFGPDDADARGSRMSMYSTIGARRLLSLPTGLANVRAACHSKESLWVLAGNPGDERMPEGLWRLDAAIVDRRQAVRPVCVARIDSPVALAGLPDGRLLVVHGREGGTIECVGPESPAGAAE